MSVIFRCKMCAGSLEVSPDMTIGICEYCGTQQTLPKDTDEKKANLFNRANHFRVAKEFDKAISIYDLILNDYPNEAEAHWGIALCKYGIEYVEDPHSHKRVPTCHRLQYDSILNSTDYQATIENADVLAKQVYVDDAQVIDAIQKKILSISSKERPFDVFICYKEKDERTGSRTKDSVRAQNLYDKLTYAGFRVFFSRITLEDKLGMEYEPYIFAALNSAKVMIVIGSNPEYLNSVWVKNEWNRFLSIVKKHSDRILIPAYFEMDPYDMPTEFAHLQAQDMSKMGFEQDLIRVIKKVTQEQQLASKSQNATTPRSEKVESLIEKGYDELNLGEYTKATKSFEGAQSLTNNDQRVLLGLTLSNTEDIKKSKYYYKKLIEQFPEITDIEKRLFKKITNLSKIFLTLLELSDDTRVKYILDVAEKNNLFDVSTVFLRKEGDQEYQRSYLEIAATKAPVNVLKYMLEKTQNIDLVIGKPPWDHTALMGAVWENNVKNAEIMLKSGANPNIIYNDGYSPLSYIVGSDSRMDMFNLFIKHGARLDAVFYDKKQEEYPLIYYAWVSNSPQMLETLIKKGADINKAINSTVATPILNACWNNCIKAVEVLIRYGADVNCVYKNHYVPINQAINRHYTKDNPYDCMELIRLLLDNGADVVHDLQKGYFPLLNAIQKYINSKNKDIRPIELLLERGAALKAAYKFVTKDGNHIRDNILEPLYLLLKKYRKERKSNNTEVEGDWGFYYW